MTGLDALEKRIVPPLIPTKPPTILFAPVLVTGPAEVDRVIRPGLSLLSAPMNPPSTLLPPPLTAPVAELSEIMPSLAPANPPARLPAPTLTLPPACEPLMKTLLKYGDASPLTQVAQGVLEPTSPPARLALPACTSPVATDDRIVPELSPTKPPTCRFATLGFPTFPAADEPEIRP